LPGLPGGTNSDGGGTNSSDGGGITNYGYTLPNYTITTNYANYTNFWLVITNYSDGVVVTIESTLSNLTYAILTNGNLATTNWGIWQILTASNSFTAAPPLVIGSNELFFTAALIGTTGTNGLPDWWQMEYFGALNVDPYADPDNDGLCNLDEYQLGTNPTNAYSVTPLHNDAQALFLAYTSYDTNCRYGLIVSNGLDTNTMLVTMVNTVAGMNYQIYTRIIGDSTLTWRVETNFVGSNTATTVPVYLNGRSLRYVGGFGEDSDGDGLPDGYEVLCTLTDPLLPDTGLTGTPDGYKDPGGDGYSNLQEMYNGTNPHVFNAPAAPIVSVAPMPGGSGVLISWEPAPGDVNSYTVYQNGVAIKTLPADSTSYPDGGISVYPGSPMPAFQVVVQYVTPSGSTNYSSPSMPQTPENQNMAVSTAILRGPHGQYFLAAPNIPNAVTNLRMFAQPVYSEYPNIFFNIYSQPMTNFNSSATAAYLDIPSVQFSNGLFPLPQSFLPYYNAYTLFCIPMGTNGAIGPTNFVSLGFFQLAPDNPNWFNSETASLETGLGGFWSNLLPFLDGTAQLQQNLIFQLESADEVNALEFAVADEGDLRPTAIPMNEFSDNYFLPNYAWANFHVKYGEEQDSTAYVDEFKPFEDNYFYRNFVVQSANDLNPDGSMASGVMYAGGGYVPPLSGFDIGYSIQIPNEVPFAFPDYACAASGTTNPAAALLSTGAQMIFSAWPNEGNIGVSTVGYTNLSLAAGQTNLHGLPYLFVREYYSDGTSLHSQRLSPGAVVGDPAAQNGFASYFYPEVQAPALQTVGYYFGVVDRDYLPGDPNFTPTTGTSAPIIATPGVPLLIGAWAEESVNGSTNTPGYLEQYFDQSCSSNALSGQTTNQLGILSEYGEFFPTDPGLAVLTTKTNFDGAVGTLIVPVVGLYIDGNHDGAVDTSFSGPDSTSAQHPYVLWANNDYDRWNGTTEDDLQTAAEPDCNYTNAGNRAIPCPRDLEDYARLWVCGVSNTLSQLPAGSTVTLNWGDVGGPNPSNPTIDLFQAADPDGGIGYLTNLATANNQINNTRCQYVGRLGPGGSIQLNTSTFSNGWAGDHYIWCGVGHGSGALYLTIADGNGNVLAQSSQFIKIQDIKQMYERWTVGDNPGVPPLAYPVEAQDNYSPGYPTQPFNYTYDPAFDTNNTYIVYVHGWNMPSWEKDRWAETAYKRLYWQGYQGRFGSFRWPTGNGFNGIISALTDANNYNNSEWIAWKSGQPLENFLAGLNSQYPGKVYVLAHSMGNVVTGEALRLAGANVIVNTYVASQAAISARAYDNTIPADATNSYTPHVYGPDDEGHYYTNGAPPYFNGIAGASHFADFYNQEDFALHYWVIDQNFKADSLNYHYTTPSLQFPSGFYYEPPFQLPRSLTFPTNTYETFAQAVQSYSFALGAETNIASTFSVRAPVNLDVPPYDFGNHHVGHSLEFRSDNMTVELYWNQLLVSFGLKP
jgi:hypothetical protein